MNPRVFISKGLHRLRYELFQAPRGQGRPIAREAWEKMYREGAWDRLNDFSELGHYAVIAGYVRAFSERATVWDVGCGHGRLLQLLQPHFSSYVGVDISAEAIARAEALQMPRASFVVSRFEDWSPDDKADVIIFNESVTYATHPAELVRSYANRLNDGGRIIISLVEYGNHNLALRKIASVVELVSGIRIENMQGQAWNVRMFKARASASA
jgi:2-polyprenyl-3-methyl-5-hydroxy-6-metoxy-1,4-benzoquinol methylase